MKSTRRHVHVIDSSAAGFANYIKKKYFHQNFEAKWDTDVDAEDNTIETASIFLVLLCASEHRFNVTPTYRSYENEI